MVEVLVKPNDMRSYLEQRVRFMTQSDQSIFGLSKVDQFLLDHGMDFEATEKTFEGPRMEQGMCYMNCTHMILRHPELIYVEGYVGCHGVPINHAWLTNRRGELIDPTLTNIDGHNDHYFGVAFDTKYVLRTIQKNDYYGLLDGYYNRKTLPALIEGRSRFKPKGFK